MYNLSGLDTDGIKHLRWHFDDRKNYEIFRHYTVIHYDLRFAKAAVLEYVSIVQKRTKQSIFRVEFVTDQFVTGLELERIGYIDCNQYPTPDFMDV